jgi:hypothetical protein
MSVLGSARVLFTAETADAHRGIAEVQRAYQGATRNIAGNLERQNSATLRVTLAQRRYQDAIRRSGADSNQAVSALIRLRDAEERVARSTVEAGTAAGRSGAGFRRFGEDAERGARGALAGSRLLHGARSALVFGSTSFLGAFGATALIRRTVDAAREQEQVQASLRQTLRQTGISYAQNRDEIERTIQAQSRLSAFDDEQLVRSFTSLVRRTGDVNQALRLNAVAADVARGRHMDLQAAVTLVTRASLGQVGSLRRLGLDVRAVTAAQDALRRSGEKITVGARRQAQEQDRVATSQRVIAALQRSYGGQAAAYSRTAAGAQDRFNKTLNDTEEIIGRAVTPQLTRLFNSLGQYLQRINSTGELQRNVNQAMRDGTQITRGVVDVFRAVRTVLGPVNSALGGTRHTVMLVAEAFVGLRLVRLAREFGLLQAPVRRAGAAAAVSAGEFDTLAASEGRAAEVNAGGAMLPAGVGVARTGDAAVVAQGKIGRLRGSLLGLNLINVAPIVVPIVVDIATRENARVQGILGRFGAAGHVAARAYGLGQFFASGGAVGTNPITAAAHAFGIGVHHRAAGGRRTETLAQAISRMRGEGRTEEQIAAQIQQWHRDWTPEEIDAVMHPGGSQNVPTYPGRPTTPATRPVSGAVRQRIVRDVARASLGVSRGEAGAQQRLVAALRRQIDQDRRDEELQQRLARTDVKHRKQHLEALQGLYADEQGALDQITGIEQEHAQKTAEARRKAAAAREKALREQRREAVAEERQRFGRVTDTLQALTARARTFAGRGQFDQERRILREQEHELEQFVRDTSLSVTHRRQLRRQLAAVRLREQREADRQRFGQVTDVLRGFTARLRGRGGAAALAANRATLRAEERQLEQFVRDTTLSLEHRRRLRDRLARVRQQIADINRQIREANVKAAQARAERPNLLVSRAEARAALTEGTDDDLRAFRAEENLIRRRLIALGRLKHLTNQQLQSQIDLLDQQRSVRDRINEIIHAGQSASQNAASNRGAQGQAFLGELSGVLGQFASNVASQTGGLPTGSGPLGGAAVAPRPVTIEQHFHAPVSAFGAQQAARQAATHYPV